MGLYIHVRSEHHPSRKQAVLITFIQQTKTKCNAYTLNMELNNTKTFRLDGCSNDDIRHDLVPKQKSPHIAMITYQQDVLNKIIRLLAIYNIKTIHIPVKEIHMFRSINNRPESHKYTMHPM